MRVGSSSARRGFGKFGLPVAALALAIAVVGCGRMPASTGDGSTGEMKLAPDFTLADLTGRTVRLSDSAGRVRLIDFWATWCPPCREAIPDLNEMYADYEKDGLSIIGISMDDDAKDSVPAFIEKYKIRYTMLVGDEDVADKFGGVFGLPTTILLDREGRITDSWVGGIPKEVIEKRVRSVLGLAPKA